MPADFITQFMGNDKSVLPLGALVNDGVKLLLDRGAGDGEDFGLALRQVGLLHGGGQRVGEHFANGRVRVRRGEAIALHDVVALAQRARRGRGRAVPDDGRRRVSDRYLSELFLTLARHGIPPADLVGDLPIPVDEHGHVTRSIHWDHFSTFLRRLEHHVGGSEGLERCGEWLCSARNNRTIRRILAFSTSPASLYRAAMTGLVAAAREVKDRGTFGYLDEALPTPELNAFMES